MLIIYFIYQDREETKEIFKSKLEVSNKWFGLNLGRSKWINQNKQASC